jgi:hypothetical protein
MSDLNEKLAGAVRLCIDQLSGRNHDAPISLYRSRFDIQIGGRRRDR